MKKASLQTLVSFLTANDIPELSGIKDELVAELAKDEVRKQASADAYEAVHAIVVGSLSDTPATCAELFDSVESELPTGFSKGKFQYALTHLWQDEIVKVPGKPNMYKRA